MNLKKLAFNGIKAMAFTALVGGSALIVATGSGCSHNSHGCCERKCGGCEKRCEKKCPEANPCAGHREAAPQP